MREGAGEAGQSPAATDLNALSTADALMHTVRRLWPGAEVRTSRRRVRRSDRGADLCFLPDAGAPRLVVPSDPAGASRSMRRFSEAISARETVQRLAVGAALRIAGGWLLPDRVSIAGRGGLTERLAELLGEPVTVSIGIGNARANRKPVVGVFDRRGRQVAFVKVGDNEVTTRLVTDEAESLRRVAAHRFTTFAAPSLLALDDWEGLRLLVMTALPTSAWRRRAEERRRPPLETMDELASAFAEGSMTVTDTPSWKRCLVARDDLVDGALARRYSATLDAIATRWGHEDAAVGAWHGDFTPWNMARRRGVVQLWDWERFETGVPMGFDRAHWSMQTNDRARTGDAAAIGGALADPAAGVSVVVAVTYLATLVGRYLIAAQEHHGAAINDHAVGALAALEQMMSSP